MHNYTEKKKIFHLLAIKNYLKNDHILSNKRN